MTEDDGVQTAFITITRTLHDTGDDEMDEQ